MNKIYLEEDVLNTSKSRILHTLNTHEKNYLCLSGGKDSTLMLHLVMDIAIEKGINISVLFVDLEAQYKLTIEHIENCLNLYKDHVTVYWVCLPLNLRNAVSVYEPNWVCWDDIKKDKWVRPVRTNSISSVNYFPFFVKGMEFEDFVYEFGKWFSNGAKTACFIGIRTNESLNRFRAVTTSGKDNYITKSSLNVNNVYPIYDWSFSDIWRYHSGNLRLPMNKIYDLMKMAGVTDRDMRICQPYGDEQKKGLWLYQILEPETWSKVVLRVSGVNSGAKYIKEQGFINGINVKEKPNGKTWEGMSNYIIESMPTCIKSHYVGKVKLYESKWSKMGYENGIPDEACRDLEALNKAPSWRKVFKALLKNDYHFKTLGFSQPKTDIYGLVLAARNSKIKLNGIYGLFS